MVVCTGTSPAVYLLIIASASNRSTGAGSGRLFRGAVSTAPITMMAPAPKIGQSHSSPVVEAKVWLCGKNWSVEANNKYLYIEWGQGSF